MSSSNPVSPKVTAATLAAAVVGFVIWILDLYVLTPGTEDGVPAPVTVLLMTLGAFAAGYRTRDPRRVG